MTCHIHPPEPNRPAQTWLELDVLTEYEDRPA